MKSNRIQAFAIAFLTAYTAAGQTAIPSLHKVFEKHFILGVSIAPSNTLGREGMLLKKHFSSLTTENVLKMEPVHPEENRYQWAKADSIADFAQENGIRFRGHTLVWHKQCPDWMFKEKDGSRVGRDRLLKRLKEHIQTVAGRYKGRVYAWDVVNEAISDNPSETYTRTPFYEIIGEEYIELAFRWAHEADPNALLFYNDYRETDPVKRRKIIKLVTDLKNKGVPIHGVGLQGHWSIHDPSADVLEATLRDYAATGLLLHITELDVSVWSDEMQRREKSDVYEKDAFTEEMDRLQQEQYTMVFEKFRKYADAIDAVIFWCLSDGHSWLNNWPVRGRKDHPLLFDRQLNPKSSFWRVVGR
jgi:endo-1,4-beta-xylanase